MLDALRPLAACAVIAVSGSRAARRRSPTAGWTTSATNLYNLYGSTEVAWATIATPEDLRAAPGHGGHAAARHGREDLRRRRPARSPQGETGRIFVGNEMPFEGYTGGGNKDVIDGLMSTGDVGHFDDGRPPVRRRPRRRHDRLRRRERLPARGRGPARRATRRSRRSRSSASTDEEFGQRLRAFVVLRKGAAGRPRTSSRSTSRPTSPATRCRARSCSSTSCRATRPARSLKREPRRRTERPRADGRTSYPGGHGGHGPTSSISGGCGSRSGEGRRLELAVPLEPFELRRPALRAGARRGAGRGSTSRA